MKIIKAFLLSTILLCGTAQAALRIVAGESVYGELAKSLGGEFVQVKSVLNNPNQDPHLFSATPSIARAVADADIIIYNGLGYDEWMKRLTNSTVSKQQVMVVSNLVGKKSGANPHLWYDPAVMSVVAQALTQEFKRRDPANQKQYDQRLKNFQTEYQQFTKQIQRLKQTFENITFIATEPLFQYMADVLGWHGLGMELQMSLMNHTAPTPKQLKQFEDAIIQHKARVLIYNQQVNQPLTERLHVLARQAGVPVVGMTETQPAGLSYWQWMGRQLDALENALLKKFINDDK